MGYRILLVDDAYDVRQVLAAGLRTLGGGLEVLEVPSAEEALYLAGKGNIDLIVCDVRLAGMSGLELVSRVRKRNPDLKIILFTGLTDDSIHQQMAQAGVDGVFYKPVPMGDFLEKVDGLLAIEKAAIQTKPDAPKTEGRVLPETAPGMVQKDLTGELIGGPNETSQEPSSNPLDPTSRLSQLYREINASVVVMVDRTSNAYLFAGDQQQLNEYPYLVHALSTALVSSRNVSLALGGATPDHCYLFTSTHCHLYAMPIGAEIILFALFNHPAQVEKFPMVNQAFEAALSDLQYILARQEAERTLQEQAPQEGRFHEQGEASKSAGAQIDAEKDEAFEAIFSMATQSTQKDDVDTFWDTSRMQPEGDVVTSSEGLSYEQARRLGLAPDSL